MKNIKISPFMIMTAVHLFLCVLYFFLPGSPNYRNTAYTIVCCLFTAYEVYMFWIEEKYYRFRIVALMIILVMIVLLILSNTGLQSDLPGWGYICLFFSLPAVTAIGALDRLVPDLYLLSAALAVIAVLFVRTIRSRKKNSA